MSTTRRKRAGISSHATAGGSRPRSGQDQGQHQPFPAPTGRPGEAPLPLPSRGFHPFQTDTARHHATYPIPVGRQPQASCHTRPAPRSSTVATYYSANELAQSGPAVGSTCSSARADAQLPSTNVQCLSSSSNLAASLSPSRFSASREHDAVYDGGQDQSLLFRATESHPSRAPGSSPAQNTYGHRTATAKRNRTAGDGSSAHPSASQRPASSQNAEGHDPLFTHVRKHLRQTEEAQTTAEMNQRATMQSLAAIDRLQVEIADTIRGMAARQYEFCDLQQNGLQWQETLHNDVQDIPERIAEQLSETTSKIYDVAEATHHLAGIRDDLNHLKITVAGMTPLAKDRHEAYEKQIAELQDVVQTLRNSIHEQPVRISESLQQFAAEVAEQQYERLRTELRDDRMSRDEHRQEIRELQGMLVGLRTMLVQPEGSRASTSQAASTSTPRRILVPSTPDRLLEDIVAHDYDPPAMDSDPAPLDSASQCGQRVMGHGREADARPEHAADDDVDFTDYEALPNALKRTTGRRASQVQTPRDQQTVEPPPSAPAPRKSGQAGGRKTPKGSRKYASTSKKRALPAELEDGEDKDRYLQHASPNRPGRTFDLAVGLQEAEDECSEQQQAPSADPKPAAQRSRTRPAAAKAPKRGRGKQSANQAKIAESFEGAPRYQTRKQTRDLHLQDNLLSPLA